MVNPVSAKTTLVSLAMLNTYMDRYNENYIDYFNPYFLQIIKKEFDIKKTKIELDFEKIQGDVKSQYGLEIPLQTIGLIIKRIAIKYTSILKKDNIEEQDKYFIISAEGIADNTEKIEEKRKSIIILSEALYEFSQNHILKFRDIEDAFQSILAFLSEFPVEILSHIQNSTILPKTCDRNPQKIVLISLFIEHLNDNDKENYNNFSDLVKGYMLTNALLCTNLNTNSLDSHRKNRTINARFYIDSPVFLDFIGLGRSGKIGKKSIEELFSLIKNLGGRLCMFTHTVKEIKNILSNLIDFYDKRPTYAPRSQIVETFENLEMKIKNKQITIVYTPTVAKNNRPDLLQYQIDEARLEEKLKNEMEGDYKDRNAAGFDTRSIVGIHLLRQQNKNTENFQIEHTSSLITIKN